MSAKGRGALFQWQGSHDRTVEAIDHAGAAVGDQRNLAGLSRLKSYRRSSRNIEAISKCGLAVELERRVGLGEVIVTADLDRPDARVGDRERNRRSVAIQNYLAGCGYDLAGNHVSLPSKCLRLAPLICLPYAEAIFPARLRTQTPTPMPAAWRNAVASVKPARYESRVTVPASVPWA